MRQAVTLPRATLLAAGLIAAFLGPTAPAQAQEEIRTVPARGQPVMERSRPEVDPAGVRLGGFRFDASAAAGIGYDDNLFGSNRARRGDGFGETALRARLASDWTTHEVGVSAGLTDRRYFSENNLDWTDWDASVFGRYDIDSVTALRGSYTHRRLHLDPQNVDAQQAGLVEPVPYDVDEVDVGIATMLNRIPLGASATYARYRYQDEAGAGGVGTFSVFDYDTLTLRLDSGYQFMPGRTLTVGLRHQTVTYQDRVARDRDSETWAALVGFRYDFDGIWAARIAVGYARREYSGAQFKPIETPAVDIAVTWNVTPLTTLSFAAGRAIRESIRTNSASYVSDYAVLRADHELYRNIILSASAGLDRQDYQQPSQTAVDGVLRVSAMWLVNRHIAVTLDYQYTNRLSRSGGLPDFDENVVFLRARFAI